MAINFSEFESDLLYEKPKKVFHLHNCTKSNLIILRLWTSPYPKSSKVICSISSVFNFCKFLGFWNDSNSIPKRTFWLCSNWRLPKFIAVEPEVKPPSQSRIDTKLADFLLLLTRPDVSVAYRRLACRRRETIFWNRLWRERLFWFFSVNKKSPADFISISLSQIGFMFV